MSLSTELSSFTTEPPVRPRLTVDLDAIAWNWRHLAALAAPAEVAAVVKADAYGLGAAEVAPALWRAGARTFFVARVDEGLALRRVVPRARILVLDGLALGGLEECLGCGLDPILNQPAELALWRETARRRGQRLSTALHADTGMLRLGFSPREIERLEDVPDDAVSMDLLVSHLACADEPGHALNERQRQRFDAIRARWPNAAASFANSAGIFLGKAYHHDICRPGIALWGSNPTPDRPNPMRPVVRLEAPILQVHEVDAAGTLGYGATHVVQPGSRIATLPLGYADGVLRAAGGRATARVAGIEVPLVGRISMDLITLDVTAVPTALARPGAMVELLGGRDGVDRLAEAAGTIAYEVLTRLGGRLERIYRSDRSTL